MNKYLPPSSGLWHLGSQCDVDQYIDVETNECFDVKFFDYADKNGDVKYEFGSLHGKSIQEAKEALTALSNSLK